MKLKWIFITALTSTLMLSANCFWNQDKQAEQSKEKENVSLIGTGNFTPKRDLMTERRDKTVGNILINALETYHYKKITVNDDTSVKAFKEFIKNLDYGKQFFLKEDVDALKRYEKDMDNEMLSGDHKLLYEAMGRVKARINDVEKYRAEFFKSPMDFTKDETLELDSDKREFPKSAAEHKEYWRKAFKQATLSKLMALVEEQESYQKAKKDPKFKKELENKKKKRKESSELTELSKGKILSFEELKVKAQDSVAKKYKNLFSKLMKEDHDEGVEKFFNAVAEVFCPHTAWMPPKRKEDFDIDITGQLEGIGAVLSEENGFIKVNSIVPGGAAWRQKELEVDDTILAVQQGSSNEVVDLEDMKVDDAVRYIRGKKGTVVKLHVKKATGVRKIIPITRQVVHIGESYTKSSVLSFKEKPDFKIGYINVPKFYRDFEDANARNCSDDVKKELEKLKKKNVNAIILDLRTNGGGSLEDARIMTGEFVGAGPVVQIKDQTGKVEVLENSGAKPIWDGPMVVLVNRFSASASEIVAGALQDYKRAVVVGTQYTHGKGTVQAVMNLNQGPLVALFGPTLGALKVTIQKFYRVTGESTQFKGVTPDIILPDPFSYTKSREQDLDNALPWDKIESSKFSMWPKSVAPHIPELVKRSKERVKTNSRFQKLSKSIEFFEKKKNDTTSFLSFEKAKKEEADNKKTIEELKLDEENKSIIVTDYEASLQSVTDVKKGEESQWKKDFNQRKEDYVRSLRQDVGLEEGMNIAKDLLELSKR